MTTTPLTLTWALLRAYIRLSEHPGWAAYLLRPVLWHRANTYCTQHLSSADEPPSILQDWMRVAESCVLTRVYCRIMGLH